MKHLSIAALAAVAVLSGCATTEPQDTNAAAPAPEARSGQPSASSSTGTASSGQVGSRGTASSARSQAPDLKRSVYYEFDKFEVKPEYRALVESHARWLKANPNARLVIEGNADEQGSREYNLALGQRRAESVIKMMQLLGVKGAQLEAISYGEERPRINGHDEKAWSENRRADFAQR